MKMLSVVAGRSNDHKSIPIFRATEKEILVEFRLNQNGLNFGIYLFLSYLFITVFGVYIDFALMSLIVLS